MSLYCGIDLHANNSVISLLGDEQKIVFEKRLPNDIDVIRSVLSRYAEDIKGIAVESTYNWYWLVDGLMDAGYSVHLANTVAIQQYSGLKYTNDYTDASHLAHLLQLNILKEGYIYPKEQRAVRDLLRRRMFFVRQRTVCHLSLQSLIARHTGKRMSSNQIKQLDSSTLSELLPESLIQWSGELTLSTWHSLDSTVKQLEKAVYEANPEPALYELLTSIPGVGQILALTIQLETGDIKRFSSPGRYASYARCVRSEKISNNKIKGQGNKKNGNKYLAWAMVEAGHFAAIWDPRIKRFYQRKQAHKPVMVAKKILANKLARAIYHMLKQGQRFDLERAFGS